MIAEPPWLTGPVKTTVTAPFPAVAAPIVGASGTVAGVTLFERPEAALSPTAFVATTLQVTAVPFGSPVTGIGELVPVPVLAPQVAV